MSRAAHPPQSVDEAVILRRAIARLRAAELAVSVVMVSWPGAVIGLAYGALLGAVIGAAIALVYNTIASARNGGAFGSAG